MIIKNEEGKIILNHTLSADNLTKLHLRLSKRVAGVIYLMAALVSLNTLILLATVAVVVYQFPQGQRLLKKLLELRQFYSILGTATITGLFFGLLWVYKKIFSWWIDRFEKRSIKYES
jgi:hypothetical protein